MPHPVRRHLVLAVATLTAASAVLARLSPPAVRAADQPPAAKPAPAAPPAADEKSEKEQVITRVYDVRDLLASVANYPFVGTMAGSEVPKEPPAPPPGSAMGGGMGAAPKMQNALAGGNAPNAGSPDAVVEPQSPTDQFLRLITDTIAPNSWKDSGGDIGALHMSNGLLVVTQTDANHKELASILTQLRESHARMVRVRAHWLLLQPGEVDALYKKAAGGAGGPGGAAKPESAFPEIDRDALEKAGAKSAHYRAETLCFNGQTVHITSGRARRVVSSVTAAVGTSAAAYEPEAQTVRNGLMLQVTPLLSPDRPSASLDVHSAFSDADPGEHAEGAQGAQGAQDAQGAHNLFGAASPSLPMAAAHSLGTDLAVDRYRATSQELRTTVHIPLGRPVLVGGMTLDPTAKGADSPQLYLVVELTASE